MSDFPEQEKLPREYIINENPFAFARGYSKGPFLDEQIKRNLDAVQHIQPKFIPFGVDTYTLKDEQAFKIRKAVENTIKDLLDEGMKILQRTDENKEDILIENIENEKILEILIKINQLRLLTNQKKLRERVFLTIKDNFPADIVSTVKNGNESEEEGVYELAVNYEKMEKNYEGRSKM